MKQIMVVMLALGIGFAANAQPKVNGNIGQLRPRVYVAPPVYPVYPRLGMGYGFGYGYAPGFRYSPFYSPFNDPFYRGYRYQSVPQELQLEIDDINNDFDYRIAEARRDKSVSGKERRQHVRDLKNQRENALIDAKRAYYKSMRSSRSEG
ncbi:hypothetical protein EXU57_06860 [Segetibacter sp. 3557_3]|uniref:hypothetical protein n=1 Tax=Segetibacter sp. 3557_3 TaxID=2547429 RepID=UPI001058ACC0|nr:hypothetical protein [Segetibacter sp. 3557_3]TDH27304.1 hypothetical protein EXU57_06860 [Segetibacter sp. 3557_3]